jgi:hypothetical protein
MCHPAARHPYTYQRSVHSAAHHNCVLVQQLFHDIMMHGSDINSSLL